MRRVTSTPPSRNDKVVLTNSANQVCLNVPWIFLLAEIDPHHATEHRSTDQSRNGCGMCCFCHAQPFEITRAKNIKNPLVQRSCQNAEVVEAFCSRRVHHRDRHQHTIPIALAALPGATLPRLRALALFGRRPPQRVDSLLMPASENLHRTGLMQRSKKRCLLDHLVGALTSVTGTVSSSAFAVLRLSDNSNLEA